MIAIDIHSIYFPSIFYKKTLTHYDNNHVGHNKSNAFTLKTRSCIIIILLPCNADVWFRVKIHVSSEKVFQIKHAYGIIPDAANQLRYNKFDHFCHLIQLLNGTVLCSSLLLPLTIVIPIRILNTAATEYWLFLSKYIFSTLIRIDGALHLLLLFAIICGEGNEDASLPNRSRKGISLFKKLVKTN